MDERVEERVVQAIQHHRDRYIERGYAEASLFRCFRLVYHRKQPRHGEWLPAHLGCPGLRRRILPAGTGVEYM